MLIASISSSTFIVPIWAVKAAPERPATRTELRIGESSRQMPSAMPSATKRVAP